MSRTTQRGASQDPNVGPLGSALQPATAFGQNQIELSTEWSDDVAGPRLLLATLHTRGDNQPFVVGGAVLEVDEVQRLAEHMLVWCDWAREQGADVASPQEDRS